MKKLAEELWTKYKAWPWWGKIVGVLLLVCIAVLLVLAILPSPEPTKGQSAVDSFLATRKEEERAELEKENGEELDKIQERKKEIATKVNQAKDIDAETVERREEIDGATTMEDLDALQDKWGL